MGSRISIDPELPSPTPPPRNSDAGGAGETNGIHMRPTGVIGVKLQNSITHRLSPFMLNVHVI